MAILIRRAALLAFTMLANSAVPAHAQSDKSWIAVPGWINPDSAAQRTSGPFLGDMLYESGSPVAATLLTGAQMASVDLVMRGAFRYHDSRGVAHDRSWLTSLGGLALGVAANVFAKSMAPSAARRANAERLAEAESRARELAASVMRPLPGLAPGDTVSVRSPNGATRAGFVVSATLAGDQLYFREDGSVGSRADSTQTLRLASVRRRVRSPNPIPMALGFAAGLGGSIVICAKRFENCFPYTTMWATSMAGYGIGRLMPITMTRSMSATAVRRD